MAIPFFRPLEQSAILRSDIKDAIGKILDSGKYINGDEVCQLEAELARRVDQQHGIAVSSGTDALLATLYALDPNPDSVCVTTPLTFIATVESICRANMLPAFVDVDPDTYNLDPAALEDFLDYDTLEAQCTEVVLPVHLFGLPANMEGISRIARQNGLHVVEDCAQSLGAVGTMRGSTASCTSFFPTKNLGGFGDGGMIFTDDSELSERIRNIRRHGLHDGVNARELGGNFRLDTVQAAGLIKKIPWFQYSMNERKRTAAIYNERLADCVKVPLGENHTYNQYVIMTPRRDELKAYLTECGIGCKSYYTTPMHLQDCFASLGYVRGDFPNAERIADENLALPIYPGLSVGEAVQVTSAIRRFFGG
jgi:dTDP-4-amino-4,6-dideoxygalactose transaminase